VAPMRFRGQWERYRIYKWQRETHTPHVLKTYLGKFYKVY
jgi:hypothetical protein